MECSSTHHHSGIHTHSSMGVSSLSVSRMPSCACSGTAEGAPCAVITDPTSRCPTHRKLFLHLIAGKEKPQIPRGPLSGASFWPTANTTETATEFATASRKHAGKTKTTSSGSFSESPVDNPSGSEEGTAAVDEAPADAPLAPPMELQEQGMYRVSWRESGAFRKSYIECILLGASQ